MKILQIGKFYPVRGGVEKVMFDLTEGLGRKGIHCDMLCAAFGEYAGKTIQINPFSRVICAPAMARIAATMISPAMVVFLRKHKDYDLVHVHHPDPMAALALRLSGYKGPVIVHWHSDIVKQKLIYFFFRPLQNWLLKRASLILGTSPVYVRESPHLSRFRDKISHLPIGIDEILPDDGGSEIRSRWPEKKIVFSLGRFVEYKGFEYLVKAAGCLSEDYHIIIGGDGPLRPSIQSMIDQLGLGSRITCPGRIPDEELPAYFSACDVFVLSSTMKTEAFAIVQIEAMSLGKPVVSTRIPGSGVSWVNSDGQSGISVPICDSEALAGAIESILNSPERYAEFSHGARKRYLDLFTREAMTDGAIKIYREVASRGTEK